MSSALGSTIPSKEGNTGIHIEVANDTLKKEIESDQYPLLNYLKSKLNNYELELIIEVNEEISKQHYFTSQDKYEKLRELNPMIDQLRREFDLDL